MIIKYNKDLKNDNDKYFDDYDKFELSFRKDEIIKFLEKMNEEEIFNSMIEEIKKIDKNRLKLSYKENDFIFDDLLYNYLIDKYFDNNKKDIIQKYEII